MSAPEPGRVIWHIAQINVAIFRVARDNPVNADFEAALDEVNALADVAPGFVWRMAGEGENDDPNTTINMTVWESIEALAAFAYRNTTHRGVMRRRDEWFIEIADRLALWWIPAGSIPTLSEGRAKLERIGRLGPTQDAFDFKRPYWPSDSG
jgi:heme-degrading monooxygenase HmoA